MGDVAVEHPPQAPHHRQIPSISSNTDPADIIGTDGGDGYSTYKRLQQELEYINLQEEYIKDEQRWGPPSSSLRSTTYR